MSFDIMSFDQPVRQYRESPISATRAATSYGYSQPMTVVSRGERVRRSGRRPGWLLLTVLLVLAMAASSALVFTSRVELLKLAVVLSLWAAVIGAFVSAMYRRQSDADAAKARDLKLVYDLQLDREISARREYELNLEAHLRRELAGEMRAQSSDEVAALRAELAALRTSLEILFDTDLAHRPAIETDRSFAEWAGNAAPPRPDRVASSRVSVDEDDDARTAETTVIAESPIIDVPEEPLVSTPPQRAEKPRRHRSDRRPSDVEETRFIQPVTADTAAPVPQNGQFATAAEDAKRRGRHAPRAESAEANPAEAEPPPPARHRGVDDEPVTGGQSVAELIARLQHDGSTEGGRRRRRKD